MVPTNWLNTSALAVGSFSLIRCSCTNTDPVLGAVLPDASEAVIRIHAEDHFDDRLIDNVETVFLTT